MASQVNAAALVAEQSRLRVTLLDRTNAIPWRPARELTAMLLLSLDSAERCWQLSVSWLREAFDADRVDGGPSHPSEPFYTMGYAQATRLDAVVSAVNGIQLDACDEVITHLWHATAPVVLADMANESRFMTQTRARLVATGAKTKMAAAVHHRAVPCGLICMDHIFGDQQWTGVDHDRFCLVTRDILGPVMAVCEELQILDATTPRSTLTTAESRVLSLTAMGYSYKEIAFRLGRSVYTVDHQLRSIRSKFGVNSNARLLRLIAERNMQMGH